MKSRVKVDNAILSFIIIVTGVLLLFPRMYPREMFIDDCLDFFGMIVVLGGTFLRMVSRGFKKAHSEMSGVLVVSGPYKLVRNPMYLGSFLMGTGFILIVWPWWAFILFAVLFYLRFKKQIEKEEKYLNEKFGREYVIFKEQVPRLFPSRRTFRKAAVREVFPFDLAWTTKEKWGLAGWPAAALLLEMLQENIVYGLTDFTKALAIFGMAIVVFAVITVFYYNRH